MKPEQGKEPICGNLVQRSPARLLRQPIRRPRLAVRILARRQIPGALAAKWQNEKLSDRQLVFVTVGGNANRDFILRYVATQGAMKFIPPAEDGSPIRVCLPLHD